jgi:hypothetical protein
LKSESLPTIPSTATSRTLQIRQHQHHLHGHESLDPQRMSSSNSHSSGHHPSSGNEEPSMFELPAARSSEHPLGSTYAQGAASTFYSSRLPSSLQGGSVVSAAPSSFPIRDAFGAAVDDAMGWSVDSNSNNIHNTVAAPVVAVTGRASRRVSNGTTGRIVLASRAPPPPQPTTGPQAAVSRDAHHEEARFTVSGFSEHPRDASSSVASTSSCNATDELIPAPPPPTKSLHSITSVIRPVHSGVTPRYVPASSTSISTRALLGDDMPLCGPDPTVSAMMPFHQSSSSHASSGNRTQSSSHHDRSPFRATLPRFGSTSDAADHSRSNAVGVNEPPAYSATFDDTFGAGTAVTGTSLQSSYTGGALVGGTTTTTSPASGTEAPPVAV